jgi:DNA-binding transcriptional MerR regulator
LSVPSAVPTGRLLADIVELRLALRETRERSVRERVRRVERSLRSALGVSVAKTAAAKALGVSVTALDRWVDRGVLPVVARKNSSRLEVETGPFLELLEQVTRLRAGGLARGVIAAAVRRLGWSDDPAGRQVLSEEIAAFPRPNVPARELREHYEATTPEQRVVDAARLSSAATRLAIGGRKQHA